MSWLQFQRSRGLIFLFNGKKADYPNSCPAPIGSWQAHNNTARSSNGPWPKGTFKYAYYNSHPEVGYAPGCHPTSYGCEGIHVFQVSGREGMGVHAGRTKGQAGVVGGKTMGCIRVPVDAMRTINNQFLMDPLVEIVVE